MRQQANEISFFDSLVDHRISDHPRIRSSRRGSLPHPRKHGDSNNTNDSITKELAARREDSKGFAYERNERELSLQLDELESRGVSIRDGKHRDIISRLLIIDPTTPAIGNVNKIADSGVPSDTRGQVIPIDPDEKSRHSRARQACNFSARPSARSRGCIWK